MATNHFTTATSHKQYSTLTAETTTNDTSSTNISTILPTTHEISIPGFLLLEEPQDYKKTVQIAQGGLSAIYKCVALSLELQNRAEGQSMVVKQVAPLIDAMSPKLRRSFYQELAIMWRFRDQPGFARVFGYSIKPACLIIKFYRHGDLSGFIVGTSLANKDFAYTKNLVLSLYSAILRAMQCFHNAGFAHCDIKPANVLLDTEYDPGKLGSYSENVGQLRPVLSDFGIARIVDYVSVVTAYQESKVNGASISYAAPEVLLRVRSSYEEHDPQIWKAGDVYALSILLLQMLCRRLPWVQRSLQNKQHSH